jgi:hypothetical protein
MKFDVSVHKLFFFVTVEDAKARPFVPGKLFQHSQIFVSKARAYMRGESFESFIVVVFHKNMLERHKHSSLFFLYVNDKEKSFIT